jgi:hypothetical protein
LASTASPGRGGCSSDDLERPSGSEPPGHHAEDLADLVVVVPWRGAGTPGAASTGRALRTCSTRSRRSRRSWSSGRYRRA